MKLTDLERTDVDNARRVLLDCKAALAKARNDALGEAAMICDGLEKQADKFGLSADRALGCQDCSSAIRALKEQT